jgi:hypothetical protein
MTLLLPNSKGDREDKALGADFNSSCIIGTMDGNKVFSSNITNMLNPLKAVEMA